MIFEDFKYKTYENNIKMGRQDKQSFHYAKALYMYNP